MKCRYEYSQKGYAPKLVACISTTIMDISAIKVGKTMYELSEGGRHKAVNARKGGKRRPTIPTLGTVCLAVGDLYFRIFSAERQK